MKRWITWLKKRLKSRFHWLGAGTILYGLQMAQGNINSLGIPPDKVGWVVIFIGLAIHVLRERTTKPVSEK